MSTGKIIRFDVDKGYGFIAQDNGGDDVFLHMNELLHVDSQIGTGTRLEYNVMDGARGLKAYGVQIIDDYHSSEEAGEDAPPPPLPAVDQSAANGAAVVNASPASVAALVSNGAGPVAEPAAATHEPPEDETCEVFCEDEFIRQITNLILESVPQLTGAQIMQLRGHMLEFARSNSWVD